MCELTKTLKYIAENLQKRQHAEIAKRMTEQDKIDFVNAVRTLDVHAQHIEKVMG